MGRLTTHVLDIAAGKPAAGVRVSLSKAGEVVARGVTNTDGRCDAPLLDTVEEGTYELVFEIGGYFRDSGVASPFLDEVPVRFKMEAGGSYHVPLVCSPWAYSTYRGS